MGDESNEEEVPKEEEVKFDVGAHVLYKNGPIQSAVPIGKYKVQEIEAGGFRILLRLTTSKERHGQPDISVRPSTLKRFMKEKTWVNDEKLETPEMVYLENAAGIPVEHGMYTNAEWLAL